MSVSDVDAQRGLGSPRGGRGHHRNSSSAGVKISFPEDLPVSGRRDDIAAAIRDHQVVIVAGETGSGKTTQLPKIALAMGRHNIAHTQPRRIAARTIAERVADELGSTVGDLVGYKVRFTDHVSPTTRIKVMTDGVLLAELHHDRQLAAYDTIIIDEAHERSLNIDFLLGYLKRLLPQRPELRVIITSATIDPESFAKHFADSKGNPAPIIEVSGRTFPVEVRYRPLLADDWEDDEDNAGRGINASGSPEQFGDNSNRGTGTGAAQGTSGHGSLTGGSRQSGHEQPRPRGNSTSPTRPPTLSPTPEQDRDLTQGVIDAVEELEREADGDVLVFLAGESDIRDLADALTGHFTRRGQAATHEILPLFGRLSAAEQHRVFERSPRPGVRRRIVLATNVAETSLTVPGIRYVIDAGTARISRYSARAKVQRLPIEAISQASATQRSGRAGRTSPGIAIRLYGEDDFAQRPAFSEPEILRTNLAAVILQMVSLELGDVEDFPFLTPPDKRGVRDGVELLRELGALREGSDAPRKGSGVSRDSSSALRDGSGAHGGSGTSRANPSELRLTRIGRDLARLPVDPRFGRMIIESKRHGVGAEVIAIVAGLTIQDPRERPAEQREKATQSHARFTDPSSDFLGLLNLWNYLTEKQEALSGSAFRRLCRAEFLNYLRVREWQDLNRQLLRQAKSVGLDTAGKGRNRADRGNKTAKEDDHIGANAMKDHSHGAPKDAAPDSSTGDTQRGLGKANKVTAAGKTSINASVDADGIHKSLLAGLLSHLGLRDSLKKDYLGARGTRFAIFPGSALFKRQPQAVMSAELVETSRLFARVNAAIDPAWVEPLAGDRLVRQYSEPHWEKSQGQAAVYERALLYGLPIVERRRVQLKRIDPTLAHELFVRHGLVEGAWPVPMKGPLFRFWHDNRSLVRRIREREERTRRRDTPLGEEAIYNFYAARVSADVTSVRDFESWWRGIQRENPDLLTMTEEALLGDSDDDADNSDVLFPKLWRQGDQNYRLTYRFEPGAEDDGLTVIVPLPLLARTDARAFQWQVPGLRTELVTALLKSLPKALRRHVVPAAEWAGRIMEELPVPEFMMEAGQKRSDSGAGSDSGSSSASDQGSTSGSSSGSGTRNSAASESPNFFETVASTIKRISFAPVDASDFDMERLPAHLIPTFAVIDERGKRLGTSKDLGKLQHRFAERASQAVAAVTAAALSGASHDTNGPDPNNTTTTTTTSTVGSTSSTSSTNPLEREVTAWDELSIPQEVETVIGRGGQTASRVRGYPSLIAGPQGVSLRVLATPYDQHREHPRGVRALLLAGLPSPLSYVQEHLSQSEKLTLAASPYPNTATLLDDCLLCLADEVMASDSSGGFVFDKQSYERLRDALTSASLDGVFNTVSLVTRILTAHREAEKALASATDLALLPALSDMRSQLAALVYPGFISATGRQRLEQLPRYLNGVSWRAGRVAYNPGRDRVWMNDAQAAEKLYADAGGVLPLGPEAPDYLAKARWMLEELRISLFAQHLGTSEPASLQRLAKLLA